MLKTLYYSPRTQFTSISSLFNAVKNKGITNEEVKVFIQKQEPSQLFKRQRRIKHDFPITSRFRFEILQMDLFDMSDNESTNGHYKYLLASIDVHSRFAFVIPMKDKKAETVTNALQDIIEDTQPMIINSDLGSEFISDAFKKLVQRQGIEINYVSKGEHKN